MSKNRNRNGSALVVVLVVCVAAASTAFFAGTEMGRKVVLQTCGGVKRLFVNDEPTVLGGTIDPTEIAYAATNMFHLFRDAQYDYIHRHGGTMAKSVTELGNGFSIGSFGSLIHEEIWLARHDRPEAEYVPESKQSRLERDILARPYRYAILPVEKCFGEALDRRMTCVLAVPVGLDDKPLLVLLGGPIRSDPKDFYRPYKIHEISEKVSCQAFRDAAKHRTPIDKTFLDRNLSKWNATSTVMKPLSSHSSKANLDDAA